MRTMKTTQASAAAHSATAGAASAAGSSGGMQAAARDETAPSPSPASVPAAPRSRWSRRVVCGGSRSRGLLPRTSAQQQEEPAAAFCAQPCAPKLNPTRQTNPHSNRNHAAPPTPKNLKIPIPSAL